MSTNSSTLSPNDRTKLIEKKQKQFAKTREKVLAMNDTIAKVSDQLKEKKASDKSVRVANARIVSHNKANELDGLKRPADRGQDIRAYTKMDLGMMC